MEFKPFKYCLSLLMLSLVVGCSNSSSGISNTSDTSITPSSLECVHSFEHVVEQPTIFDRGYEMDKCTKCGHEKNVKFTGLFEGDKELNILFVGNSYTYYTNTSYDTSHTDDDKTTFNKFKKVAEKAGFSVNVDAVAAGGYYLRQHVNSGQLSYKLSKAKYDLVFIQEQSLAPAIERSIFYNGARDICKLIRNAGSTPILYETWGRADGSYDLERLNLTNETHTQMTIAAYQAIAEELSIPVCHVGTAFYDIYTNHPDDFNLYNRDKSHPSETGTQLIAYTFYAAVFGRSPIGVHAFGISDERILERAAFKATFGESILKEEYKTSSKDVK